MSFSVLVFRYLVALFVTVIYITVLGAAKLWIHDLKTGFLCLFLRYDMRSGSFDTSGETLYFDNSKKVKFVCQQRQLR